MVGSIQPLQWCHIHYKHYLDPEQPCGHSVYLLTELFTRLPCVPALSKAGTLSKSPWPNESAGVRFFALGAQLSVLRR